MPNMQNTVVDQISFTAEMVAAQEEEYTPECVVHGLYFGTGDPERGGQHWNFTRILGDDDEGVCTVKEIQQVTVYGGIRSFTMTKTSIQCWFHDKAAQETGTRCIVIAYQVEAPTWSTMIEQAKLIFQDQEWFTLEI